VKLLREDLAGVAEIRARFEGEARAAAALAHPNIVGVYDVDIDESSGRPYLVMEQLPGRTLADEIAEGPLAPDRAIAMGVQVADALAAAHAAGIVHRDVKPGNILDAGDGTWKVADFGIAKSTESLDGPTTTGLVLCTPGYVAPERLDGQPATPASDLYSLGVVLYEAVSGERPFVAETAMGTAHLARTQAPTPLRERVPDVSPALAEVVDTALARDPSRRYPSAAAMRSALFDAAASHRPLGGDDTVPLRQPSDTATSALPPRAIPKRRDPWRPSAEAWRRTRLALIIAIVSVALVVGLATAKGGDAGPGLFEPSTPATSTTPDVGLTPPAVENELPGPLADALDRLERSIEP
jgi:serine/threonine protein kinase